MEPKRDDIVKWADFFIRTAVTTDGAERNKSLKFFSKCLAASFHLTGGPPSEFILIFLDCVNSQMQSFKEGLDRHEASGKLEAASLKYSDVCKDVGSEKARSVLDLIQNMGPIIGLPEFDNETVIPVMSTIYAAAHMKSMGETCVSIGIATSYAMLEDYDENNDFKNFSVMFMDKIIDDEFIKVVKRASRICSEMPPITPSGL